MIRRPPRFRGVQGSYRPRFTNPLPRRCRWGTEERRKRPGCFHRSTDHPTESESRKLTPNHPRPPLDDVRDGPHGAGMVIRPQNWLWHGDRFPLLFIYFLALLESILSCSVFNQSGGRGRGGGRGIKPTNIDSDPMNDLILMCPTNVSNCGIVHAPANMGTNARQPSLTTVLRDVEQVAIFSLWLTLVKPAQLVCSPAECTCPLAGLPTIES